MTCITFECFSHDIEVNKVIHCCPFKSTKDCKREKHNDGRFYVSFLMFLSFRSILQNINSMPSFNIFSSTVLFALRSRGLEF